MTFKHQILYYESIKKKKKKKVKMAITQVPFSQLDSVNSEH